MTLGPGAHVVPAAGIAALLLAIVLVAKRRGDGLRRYRVT
jgi:hypothetical protein